jgi:hypothetical protein
MKKLVYLAATALFAGAVMTTSCHKDDNDSTPSQQQREEEQQKREEEEEKAKEQINANKTIEYTCELTASETSYEGTKFDVDVKAIADELGVTVDEFILGIEGKEGGATDITTYYIQGSTGDELIGANTQVGATEKGWGHWLNKDSDVTTWGEGQAADYSITYAGQAVIWTSLHRADENSTDFVCEVGQYPAKLAEADLVGKSFVIKEGVKFDDIKVVLKITVNIKGLEALTAEVVDSKELTLTTSVYDSHEDYIELDSTEILSKLGATSFADCKFVALKADGSYAQEPDDPAMGLYWENLNGEASGYGDGNFYIGYNRTPDDENCGKIVIGQYGRKLQVPEAEGSETKVDYSGDFTARWGVFYNNKVVMVNVKVTIASYEDPEAGTFTGTPASSEKTYDAVERAQELGYDATAVDVKEQLQTTFQMTCYEIYQAFQDGSLKLYVGNIADTDPEYTATKPGYWLDKDGKGIAYGAESVVYAELTAADFASQKLVFNIGHHPENTTDGLEVTLNLIVTNGTVNAVIKVPVKVAAKLAE